VNRFGQHFLAFCYDIRLNFVYGTSFYFLVIAFFLSMFAEGTVSPPLPGGFSNSVLDYGSSFAYGSYPFFKFYTFFRDKEMSFST